MGAVKTDHKRKEDIRAIKIALKHWDRDDQAAEQNENRRRKRARLDYYQKMMKEVTGHD